MAFIFSQYQEQVTSLENRIADLSEQYAQVCTMLLLIINIFSAAMPHVEVYVKSVQVLSEIPLTRHDRDLGKLLTELNSDKSESINMLEIAPFHESPDSSLGLNWRHDEGSPSELEWDFLDEIPLDGFQTTLDGFQITSDEFEGSVKI